MSWKRRAALLIAIGLPALFPVYAQTAASDEPIIVTGEPYKKARELSAAYVREVGIARGDQQAARWLTYICPNVVGIAEPQALEARERIRAIARKVGAPLAGEQCKPNLVVVFTDEPKSFMELVARRDRSKLAVSPRRSDRDFLFGEATVRWWYETAIKSKDDLPTQSDSGPHAVAMTAGPAGTTSTSAEIPSTAGASASNQYSASLLSTPTVRAISAATVVINVTDAARFGLHPVIDLAALVSLAEIKPGAAPDTSILSLFDANSVRRELSNRDLAFLSALYRIRMDREANLQRSSLVNSMTSPR